jgi:uncharacterized membrane protein (DUF4010 family)
VKHETLLSIAVALAAGFVVGLERERTADAEGYRSQFAGGARTHPLVAASGALSVIVAREVGAVAVAGALATLSVMLCAGYVRDLVGGDHRGITSELAFVVSFLLGALAASSEILQPAGERFLVVSATAVVVTVVLSAKPLLHPLAQRLSQADVFAALKLAVIAVIVLPLLPNADMGPLRALNPFKIGLIVVLIAGVDFLGYIAVRFIGPERGLPLTGLVGGLASSTAVTLSMATRAREEPLVSRDCLVATVLAGGVMFVRLIALVAVAAPALLGAVALPLAVSAAASLAASALLWRRGHAGARGRHVRLSSPFRLSSALKFGVLLTAVFVASKVATHYLGAGGAYIAALVAGMADVDAITLSMGDLARGGLAVKVAAVAILLAAASNTITKAGIAVSAGGWRFGGRVGALFSGTLAAGAIAAILTLS